MSDLPTEATEWSLGKIGFANPRLAERDRNFAFGIFELGGTQPTLAVTISSKMLDARARFVGRCSDRYAHNQNRLKSL